VAINQSDALLTVTEQNSVTRTGTITSIQVTSLFVLVGGTVIQASYLRGADLNAGDIVAVIRQDSSWVCLGALSGFGPNEIANPSFEDDGPGAGVPSQWNLANITGVSTMSVVGSASAPEGDVVAQVDVAVGARECVFYSNAIEVVAGETWSLSGFVAGVNPTTTPVVDVILEALFFNSDATLYPPGVGGDIDVATLLDIPDAPPFSFMSGTVVVPTGFTYMRLGFHTTLPANSGCQYDFAVARKVG